MVLYNLPWSKCSGSNNINCIRRAVGSLSNNGTSLSCGVNASGAQGSAGMPDNCCQVWCTGHVVSTFACIARTWRRATAITVGDN